MSEYVSEAVIIH